MINLLSDDRKGGEDLAAQWLFLEGAYLSTPPHFQDVAPFDKCLPLSVLGLEILVRH